MRHGVATMDVKLTAEMKKDPAYRVWSTMIERCYAPSHQKHRPTYAKCTVCDDWLVFSVFSEWYKGKNPNGWQLDKDLKVPGNTVYSPETCIFVPAAVNTLFHAPHVENGVLPKGVRLKESTGKYLASISYKGKDKHLGYFHTPELAEQAYKSAKRDIIVEYMDLYDCPDIRAALALRLGEFA